MISVCRFRFFITRGSILWGCDTQRTPGDKVSDRFGMLEYLPPGWSNTVEV